MHFHLNPPLPPFSKGGVCFIHTISRRTLLKGSSVLNAVHLIPGILDPLNPLCLLFVHCHIMASKSGVGTVMEINPLHGHLSTSSPFLMTQIKMFISSPSCACTMLKGIFISKMS